MVEDCGARYSWKIAVEDQREGGGWISIGKEEYMAANEG